MNKMTVFFKKHWLTMLGGVLGAIGGWLYWHFIGCSSGTCPITASPVSSIAWGAVTGSLIFSMFTKKEK